MTSSVGAKTTSLYHALEGVAVVRGSGCLGCNRVVTICIEGQNSKIGGVFWLARYLGVETWAVGWLGYRSNFCSHIGVAGLYRGLFRHGHNPGHRAKRRP